MKEFGFGAKEPPPGTPDQAELRIKSFVRIKVVLEPGFGAREPPLGTPEQAGLRIKSLVGIKVVSEPGFGAKGRRWVPLIRRGLELRVLSE